MHLGNKYDCICIQVSLKCVPMGLITNKPALVQIMVWSRTGDKPLSKPMMAKFTDAYIATRTHWCNGKLAYKNFATLQWRHNERDDASNHQPLDYLLNRLFKAQIKENIKAPHHWPFVWGNHRSPVNSPHKGPVTRKMVPFDDVIMKCSED